MNDENAAHRTSRSGKGTQAERISERLGVDAISTGDIFRANVEGETRLGIEAKKYMDAGDFVPDNVTNKMVRDRLSEADVLDGFLLDGYPRTTAQVDYLDHIIACKDDKLDVVLQLTADDEELVAHVLVSPEQPAAMTSWAAPDLKKRISRVFEWNWRPRPSFQAGAPPVFTGGSCVRPPIVEGYNSMRIFPGEIFGLVVPGSWVQ